jgi:hypothetical protein
MPASSELALAGFTLESARTVLTAANLGHADCPEELCPLPGRPFSF